MTTFRKIIALLDFGYLQQARLLLGLTLIGTVMETLGIGLIIPAISLMVEPDIVDRYPILQPLLAKLGNPGQAQLIAGGMLIFACAYLIKVLFLTYLAWRQSVFIFGVQANLSQRLYSNYLHQPYTFHLQRNSAQLIRNVIVEVNQFAVAVAHGINFITEILVIAGVGCLLLFIEPVGTLLIIFIFGGIGTLFHYFTKARIQYWGEKRQYHEGLRFQNLQQGLGAIKEVKLLGCEKVFLSRYSPSNTGFARMLRNQNLLNALPRFWLELLAVMGVVTLVLSMMYRGLPLSTVIPTIGLFAAAAFRLMPSVGRILNSLQELRFALPVINLLHSEMNIICKKAVSKTTSLPFAEAIELKNITYTYPDTSAPALRNINLVIPKGASVGFVGRSGAGKSTLIDVILGLLSPDQGQVLSDQRDIQYDLRGWQDHIGYVPQDIYLTDDTLRLNIAFGLAGDKIDENAVKSAVKAAQLDEFITGLPGGLETMVGERGVRLSGGQRQRIGIARALYHNPAMLVLDEATSALDIATERGVMKTIKALQGDKTILIVAHRLSTVANCDCQYRLEQGELVQ